MTKLSLSQLMIYKKRLIDFRDSPDIQEIDFVWRNRLNDEIEDIENEIDPVTIKDFLTGKNG